MTVEDHDPEAHPFGEMQEAGLLWLVNRVCFHPRGYALAFHKDADGAVSGWSMLGDGSEVWTFGNDADDEEFAKVTAYFAVPVSPSVDPEEKP